MSPVRPAVVAALILTLSAAALPAAGDSMFRRGSVWVETGSDVWVFQPGWDYAVAGGGNLLIHESVPWTGPGGQFFAPAPNQILFHHQRTMYVWDAIPRLANSGETGYVPLFASDALLGEIAPRGGNFLVAGAALIEFNLRGRVTEYALPERASHIEVLADRCTLLYTLGAAAPGDRRVRRFNLCTRQQEPDFATLLFSDYAGAIRALPGGDVLVANGAGVLRYTAAGSLLRMYDAPGATHIALNQDGTEFWAGVIEDEVASLRRFELTNPAAVQHVQLGNPGMQSLFVPAKVTDLVVSGEWRAAAGTPRTRSVRR